MGRCISTMERSRWSHRLLSGGTEPDQRFTLANERTFLAWIRTSLAVLAGGVAVEAFASEIFPLEIRKVLSISLLLLAMFISSTACFRWLTIERAMRHQGPLPFPLLIPILSIGGTLVTLVLIAFVALRN